MRSTSRHAAEPRAITAVLEPLEIAQTKLQIILQPGAAPRPLSCALDGECPCTRAWPASRTAASTVGIECGSRMAAVETFAAVRVL